MKKIILVLVLFPSLFATDRFEGELPIGLTEDFLRIGLYKLKSEN